MKKMPKLRTQGRLKYIYTICQIFVQHEINIEKGANKKKMFLIWNVSMNVLNNLYSYDKSVQFV